MVMFFKNANLGVAKTSVLRQDFIVSHRKHTSDLLQIEAPALCAFLAALYIAHQVIRGLAAQIRRRGRIGSIAALLIGLQ